MLNGGWNADPNVPLPAVTLDENDLLLSFRLNHYQFRQFAEDDVGILRFSNCAKYRLGETNDEGWYKGQCRYSRIAPAWGEFYEISGEDDCPDDSDDWIRVYGSNEIARHFLFYFIDETFECFAHDWRFEPIQTNALYEKIDLGAR
jgi:hypothetical protein